MRKNVKEMIVVLSFLLIVAGISFGIFKYIEKREMSKKKEVVISGYNGMTHYNVHLILSEAEKNKIDIYELQDKIDKKLLSLEKIVLYSRKDSELSYLNANKSSSWIKISKDLYTLIKKAEAVSIISDDKYDITVMNLLRLWNFNKQKIALDDENNSIPSKSQIKEVLKTVGYKKIQLKEEDGTFYLRKLNKNVDIDLSSLSGGYILEGISKLLLDLSYKDHKINVEEHTLVRGKNQDSSDWELKLEGSNTKDFSVISVSDLTVTTSGIYKKYLQYGDKIYSSMIDVTTGYPVENRTISATVLGRDSLRTDALSSAMLLLGVEKGLEVARKLSIPVYYMYLDDNKNLSEKWNEEFGKYLVKNKD